MVFQHVPKLLLAAGVLVASAAAIHCCGGPMPVKTPGKIDRAVLRDDRLVAVTSTGHLVSVELRSQKIKDLGTFDMKLAPCVDTTGGKACIASQNRLYQVDIATGKIVRAVICDQTIQGLGCITAERAFVQHATTIGIVDLAAGKVVQTVDLGKNVRCTAHDPSTRRLYAFTAEEKCGSLAILDLEKGKIIDRVDIPELRSPVYRTGSYVYLAGDRAYVVCPYYSYGIWMGKFGYVDLKTRKYHVLTPPANLKESFNRDTHRAHGQLSLDHDVLPGPSGGLFLTGKDGVVLYQADGKMASAVVLGKDQGKLVGVWKHWVVASSGEWLKFRFMPLVLVRAK